jgi:hypothetical protein
VTVAAAPTNPPGAPAAAAGPPANAASTPADATAAAAARAAGGEACPLCGAALHPTQDWCLSCGAAARTRLAATPNWKTPIASLAVIAALALGVLAAALVKLAAGSQSVAPATTTITSAAPASPAVTPASPTPGVSTPTTALPGATTPTTSAGASVPGTTAPGSSSSTATDLVGGAGASTGTTTGKAKRFSGLTRAQEEGLRKLGGGGALKTSK